MTQYMLRILNSSVPLATFYAIRYIAPNYGPTRNTYLIRMEIGTTAHKPWDKMCWSRRHPGWRELMARLSQLRQYVMVGTKV